jgi:hypothetical protein
LFAAWQAAVQHPVEHVTSLGEFVHLQGEPSDRGGEQLCDLLAALTACAAPTALSPHPMRLEHDAPAFPSRTPRAAEVPPFLAQGPPRLA